MPTFRNYQQSEFLTIRAEQTTATHVHPSHVHASITRTCIHHTYMHPSHVHAFITRTCIHHTYMHSSHVHASITHTYMHSSHVHAFITRTCIHHTYMHPSHIHAFMKHMHMHSLNIQETRGHRDTSIKYPIQGSPCSEGTCVSYARRAQSDLGKASVLGECVCHLQQGRWEDKGVVNLCVCVCVCVCV